MRKLILVSMIVFILIGAAPLPGEDLPDYAFVEGLIGHGQAWPLSCESRSAADLAGYWGAAVSETTFFEQLPKSDNPEVGFVGSVFGTWGQTPPNPYGVHAQPIAKLLREYGVNATAHKGFTVKDIKNEIANGRPVMIWVIGRVWSGTPQTYRAKDGSEVIVAAYEHSMIAYGYDLSGIYLLDAGSGSRASFSYDNFRTSWRVLGNLAVTANGLIGADPAVPVTPGSLKEKYLVQPGDYLSKLAEAWGISWQDLAAINGITYPYSIYPGQILFTGGGAGNSDPVETPDQLPTDTPAPTRVPQPTATPEPTPIPEVIYVVKPGEHIVQISKEHDVDWKALASLNNLEYPYLVYAGQELVLPGGSLAIPEDDPSEPPEGEDRYQLYIVQQGEHLMQIARELEISWKEIAELNDLVSPYTLLPGQEIYLPSEEGNAAPSPSEPPPPVSAASGEVYLVQPGDHLYTLAIVFGVDWQTLASLNKISYPYIVYPGQEITIP